MKRFTDTDKWDRPWFRKLPTTYKLLWFYIIDKCDAGGIWYVDMELASFMTGETFNYEDAVNFFSKQIEVLNGGSRWFISDFTSFQYGPLKDGYNPHKAAIQTLKKQGLLEKVPKDEPSFNEGSVSLLDKDKDKDKEDFESFTSLKVSSNDVAKLTDVQKVVTVFKLCQGVEKEDKGWDKVFFARFSKPAKELIELLGDWKAASDCVQDTYEKMSNRGLTCTLETVIKHATEWRKDRREKEASHGVFPVQGNGNRPSVIGSN